ncbi:MAG: hypothetical protein NC485_09950 [Ruminococcus flavefaciens]|nr:hypothetical protein [Ruminococcus flavefaciens]
MIIYIRDVQNLDFGQAVSTEDNCILSNINILLVIISFYIFSGAKGMSVIMVYYNRLLGNYNTNFFSIHLFDDDISTYFHEYVHHIQNITTSYGLTYYASRLVYFMHEFVKNPNSGLYDSINNLWEKDKKIILKTIEQVGKVMNIEYSGEKVEDIVFKFNKNILSGYEIKIIESVEIKLKIQNETVSVPFTVRMIKENMARLI